MKLLLVDDERLCRALLADGLRSHGFEVTEAESSEEALGLFEPASFEYVVTDIFMDGSTGYELAKEIHEISERARTAPPCLVALTGSVTGKSAATRFSSLFDLVLNKPISVGDLALSLLRLPTSTNLPTSVPPVSQI